MSDDWTLKGKRMTNGGFAPGFAKYLADDIETLRKKLIEDLCPELLPDGESFPGADYISQDEIYKRIQKRFGVK